MDFPIENGDFPVRYVNLSEGTIFMGGINMYAATLTLRRVWLQVAMKKKLMLLLQYSRKVASATWVLRASAQS